MCHVAEVKPCKNLSVITIDDIKMDDTGTCPKVSMQTLATNDFTGARWQCLHHIITILATMEGMTMHPFQLESVTL